MRLASNPQPLPTPPGVLLSDQRSASPTCARDQWIAACSQRLSALRPRVPTSECLSLALELWKDVGTYDPVIAAEMEYESSFDD